MEALLGSLNALTQERDKYKAQLMVADGVANNYKTEISKLKIEIEASGKDKLSLENNVAHWRANYEALKKSHDDLKDEATRKNEEYKALDTRFKTLQDAKIASDQKSSKLVVELTKKVVQQKAFYLSRASKLAVDPKTLCLDDDPVAEVPRVEEPSVPAAVAPASGDATITGPGAGTGAAGQADQVEALLAEVQQLKAKLNQINEDAASKMATLDSVYSATYARALSGQQLWGAALSVISTCAGRCYSELRGAEIRGDILSGVQGAYTEAELAREEAKQQGVTLLEKHALEPSAMDKWIPDTTASMEVPPGPAAGIEDMGVEAPIMDEAAPPPTGGEDAQAVVQQKVMAMEVDSNQNDSTGGEPVNSSMVEAAGVAASAHAHAQPSPKAVEA